MPPSSPLSPSQGEGSALQEFYRDQLRRHGPLSPGALSYNSRETQIARFEALCTMLPKNTPATLLDAGCGLGDLSAYFVLKRFTNIDYTGIDIVPEMITAAQKKYPDRKFLVQDISSVNQKFDYIVASGALNIVYESQATQFDYICKYVTRLFDQSNIACGFNCLSIHSIANFDQDSRFYYTDPHALLNYCKLFTKQAKLITGYLPYDFTIVLSK